MSPSRAQVKLHAPVFLRAHFIRLAIIVLGITFQGLAAHGTTETATCIQAARQGAVSGIVCYLYFIDNHHWPVDEAQLRYPRDYCEIVEAQTGMPWHKILQSPYSTVRDTSATLRIILTYDAHKADEGFTFQSGEEMNCWVVNADKGARRLSFAKLVPRHTEKLFCEWTCAGEDTGIFPAICVNKQQFREARLEDLILSAGLSLRRP